MSVSPEKTPFLTFSKAKVTQSLLLTDLAISILSNKFTPAALRLPMINEILANKDFKIISPKIGNFKILACHLYRNAAFLDTVYLKAIIVPEIIRKVISPPVPLIKSLADKILAVAPGNAIPIPSYILANTGTTLINMNTITVMATVNITAGYIKAPLIFFLILSFFSNDSTSFNKNTSNLPLASPALIKFT